MGNAFLVICVAALLFCVGCVWLAVKIWHAVVR